MADPHGAAGGGEHAGGEHHGPSFKEKIFPWTHNFLMRRIEKQGLYYGRRISLSKGRAISEIGHELAEEQVFQVNKSKTDQLWEIEQNWAAIDSSKQPAHRQELEEEYKKISHYTTEEKIEDEIHLSEYGTNVVLPRQLNETIEYIPITTANQPLKDAHNNTIMHNSEEIKTFRQLIEHLNNYGADERERESYFQGIHSKIKEWITNDPELRKLRINYEYKSYRDFISSIKKTNKPKYSPLSIKPVGRVHFDGGKMIGPKKAEKPFEINVRTPNPSIGVKRINDSRKIYHLETVYKMIKKYPGFYDAYIKNNEDFVEWIGKEVGLKHLATRVSNVNTAQDFLNLFKRIGPSGNQIEGSPKDYKEPEYIEELMFYGFYNIEKITSPTDNIRKLIQEAATGQGAAIRSEQKIQFEKAMKGIEQVFDTIDKQEQEFKRLLTSFKPSAHKAWERWDKLVYSDLQPKNLHFKHTYEVTRRFNVPKSKKRKVWTLEEEFVKYYKKEDVNLIPIEKEAYIKLDSDKREILTARKYLHLNEDEYKELKKKDSEKAKKVKEGEIKEFQDIQFFEDVHAVAENPKEWWTGFKRPRELEAGLDERGMPLEVYPRKNKYYVLIDYWFWKTAQNPWQVKTIAKKFTKEDFINIFDGRADINGTFDFKDGKGSVDCKLKPLYNGGFGREVKEGFYQRLDILEVVNYLNTNWDAYRDDFRDGRFHKHSKTYTDYVMAAHRYDVIAKKFRGKFFGLVPFKSTVIPKLKITTTMTGWEEDPWKRKPVKKENLPLD